MNSFPIIQRELLVRARTRATYWARFGVALAGMLICLPAFLSSSPSSLYGTQAMIGQGVFSGIVGMAFLLSCAACLLTADAIGAERREGTLGLLFLTRVRDIDVLIGKFASIGLTCLLALVSFLPVLILPVLAGGVTGGETFRKGLVLFDTLFLALAIGLWTSARGHERSKAARVAALLMAGAVLAPALVGWILRSAGGWPHFDLVSPLITLSAAADTAYKVSAARYWISLLLVALAGGALLLGALVAMRVRFRRDAMGAGSITVVQQRPVLEEGPSPTSRSRRPLESEPSPMHWVLRRQRGTAGMIWMGTLAYLIGALGLVGVYYLFRPGSWPIGSWIGSWSINLAGGVIQGALFAWAASRFFIESRRTGEFELLLTTPQGAQRIVSAQWDVLRRLLRWPLVVMLVPICFRLLTMLAAQRIGASVDWRVWYGVSYVVAGVNTVIGTYALCWAALWFGLRARNQARAVLCTVGVAKGFPYVLGIVFSVLPGLMAPLRAAPGGIAIYLVVWCLPQVVGLAFYGWLVLLARRRLLRELTGAEPQPFDLRASLLEAGRDLGKAFGRVRHWTPRGEEIRNPKPEIRKKSEIRNPNSPAHPDA